MKILVTRAAGFIGFQTAKALLDRGDEVIGLDNLQRLLRRHPEGGRLAQLTPRNGFHFVNASRQDRAAVEKLFTDQRP
jgi:UDP-glucuronate 4-epimerase